MDLATQSAAQRCGRRPPPPLLVGTIVLACALEAASAQAQRLSVWLHADSAASASVASSTLAVTSFRAGSVDLDGWLRIGVRVAEASAATGAPSPERVSGTFGVGAAWRRVTTFGQLGNVTIEGGGSLAAALGADGPLGGRVWLGARGTVATVALSLALEAGNATPRSVDPVRPPPPDAAGQAALRALDDQRDRARTERGDWDLGARLGVVYRLDRTTTLGVDVSGRSLAGSAALAGSLDLRSAGVAGDVDARLGVRLERLAGAVSGAAGAGLVHAPRRGPTSWLQAWLGVGPAGVWPGVEGRWVTRALPGELAVQGSWRPWLGANTWAAALEYRHDLVAGDVRWIVGADGAPGGGARWSAAVRWERPW
jgi:hypothetical protein